MKVTIYLGIDWPKSIFQLHELDAHDKANLQKRVTRAKLRKMIAQLPPRGIGMEARGSAQDRVWEFQQLGHTVNLSVPNL